MQKYLVEPDLAFIDEITKSGGSSLKKCFQCASCSVACKLSPDRQPFPRKEMLYASWGLKERLLGNPDIWLCHNCGDCTALCPRNAKPGDILGVIRRLSINEYSKPSIINRFLSTPGMIPGLIFLPALIILAVGFLTGLLNLKHEGEQIVYAHFFPVSLIEMIFIPLSVLVALVFFFGIKRMLADMKSNYVLRGLSDGDSIDAFGFIKALVTTLPEIIKHQKFSSCTQNLSRKTNHILVSFSFFNLAIVAGAFVFAIYVLDSHGPYSLLNPVKIFANISGVTLITGSFLMIKERLKDSPGSMLYFDWQLPGLVFLLAVTGMFSELVRLANWPKIAMTIYFIHLIAAFNLIACLPYTKIAHFVYRTVAVAYSNYETRKKDLRP